MDLTQEQTPRFRTTHRREFAPTARSAVHAAREALVRDYGLTLPQICEAAGFSMSMVVRYALGLSAAEGRVCAMVEDTLHGCIALATLRHLVNAGSEGCAVLLCPADAQSTALRQQLTPLERMGVTIADAAPPFANEEFTSFVTSFHNILCGWLSAGEELSPAHVELHQVLNELHTPVHTVESPPGIHADTGEHHPSALYASSTISLGMVLPGLFHGREFVGRHYLCDISLPPAIYDSYAPELRGVFSDQPVVQIFPLLSADPVEVPDSTPQP